MKLLCVQVLMDRSAGRGHWCKYLIHELPIVTCNFIVLKCAIPFFFCLFQYDKVSKLTADAKFGKLNSLFLKCAATLMQTVIKDSFNTESYTHMMLVYTLHLFYQCICVILISREWRHQGQCSRVDLHPIQCSQTWCGQWISLQWAAAVRTP